ncbi:ParA family protein [Leptospira wolffii]|uniref:ParA family protein n=1 Tax=Leptospira wolffii TaxID=409998 RepID=UPI00034679A9|nr:ParA family protein [Leptospira wolffii]TGK61655.1 ParA family protein [Leptospira wolffii]TGK70199.1 ParA family protein [Leptospira wolffii]TGK77122.1 ParA family protein [Leptospira wolffii]TGL31026.1 ParA family protein [Leptospira wolffii]
MKHTLCIANQKGGVGKTTTSVHLAVGLAQKGERVLLVDLDAQNNATSVFPEHSADKQKDSFLIFSEKVPVREIVIPTRIEGLSLLPASSRLSQIDILLSGKLDGFFLLKEALEKESETYDWVVIDCPPSLSSITMNAFVAATGLIVPLQVSKFSLDGIEAILEAKSNIVKRFNPEFKILGALLTLFQARTTMSQTVVPMIREHLSLFEAKIPPSVAVEEAHLLNRSLFEYQPKNQAAKAYSQFTEEVFSLG